MPSNLLDVIVHARWIPAAMAFPNDGSVGRLQQICFILVVLHAHRSNLSRDAAAAVACLLKEEAVLLVVRWETNGAGLAAICLRVLRARALKILELSYKKPKKILFF